MTHAETAQMFLADLQRNLTEVEREILRQQRRERELQAERHAIIKDMRALRKFTRNGDD